MVVEKRMHKLPPGTAGKASWIKERLPYPGSVVLNKVSMGTQRIHSRIIWPLRKYGKYSKYGKEWKIRKI